MAATKLRDINLLTLFVLFALLPVILVTKVIAQDNNEGATGNGFRISPTRSELTIQPGDSGNTVISVENITSLPIDTSLAINDFISGEDESGNPRVILDENAESTKFSIKGFIGDLQGFTLAPGEKKDLEVTLNIPKDAAPGAYFGIVRAIAGNPDLSQGGNLGLVASVGSIILVTVPGDIVETMSLQQISAAKGDKTGKFFEKAPDSVVIRLKNEGNSFLKPFGKVTLKDLRGKTVYEYELNNTDPRGNVLPDSIRKFENSIENIGSFGRYTIEANISYGEGGGNIINAKTTFWVLPWKIILAIIAVLVALGFGLTKGVKAYNRRVIEKAKRR